MTKEALPTNEPLRNASVATLLEALPYIRQFHGQTMVIKYGGAAMREDDLKEAFATDIALLKFVGINPIIVHGGGPEISHYMEKMGMEVKFVEGLRVSDEQTVEVAKMVLLGKINSDILTRLKRHGQEAVGLGGEDGGLFDVKPVAESDVVGLVGRIDRVNVDVIQHIAEDYVPVISSVGTDDRRPLLQHQRRRGRRTGRRRDAGREGHIHDGRRRVDARPRRPGRRASRRPTSARSSTRSRASPAACARSSRRASTP